VVACHETEVGYGAGTRSPEWLEAWRGLSHLVAERN